MYFIVHPNSKALKSHSFLALVTRRILPLVFVAGSIAALSVMTLISVGIGAAFSKVPDALKSSLPVGEMAGVALLVFFGIKALVVSRALQYTACIQPGEVLHSGVGRSLRGYSCNAAA